jgi:CRP-like cAMP-binding protein
MLTSQSIARSAAVPATIQSLGRACRFVRNDIVFIDGDDALYCYKVVSGAVRLVKLMADGRRNIMSFRLAGDDFGIERSGAYAYSAEAVTDVVAVRFLRKRPDQGCHGALAPPDEFAANMLVELCEARNHLVTLGCRSAKERVALFLHSFACRADAKNGDAIELPMGREDMADHLGLSIETVCRALNKLKTAGVIAIRSPQLIVIQNRNGLRAVAATDV